MQRQTRYQIAGWILFILCSIFYIISSLRSKDMLMLAGSILFLAACILFLIPLLKDRT